MVLLRWSIRNRISPQRAQAHLGKARGCVADVWGGVPSPTMPCSRRGKAARLKAAVVWRVNAKWFEVGFWGHAVMVVLAAALLLDTLAEVVGFALGNPIVVISWRVGHLRGMSALGFKIGVALLSLLIGAYSVRLILWKRKRT